MSGDIVKTIIEGGGERERERAKNMTSNIIIYALHKLVNSFALGIGLFLPFGGGGALRLGARLAAFLSRVPEPGELA